MFNLFTKKGPNMSFNLHYHRNTMLRSERSHPYVMEALSMLDSVENSISCLLSGKITINDYIRRITAYDKFMWEKVHELPQKSNPINKLQNKKYSTWRELKWAPIFELIRIELLKLPKWKNTKLVLIQNNKVVETIYSNGYIATKDVDNGLAIETIINDRTYLIPVIVIEDKGGHACTTCLNGVNAQALRLHQSFPNAMYLFITDNKVTVGKEKGMEIADHINMIICERGQNKIEVSYPALSAERFQRVKDTLIERLSFRSPEQYANYIVVPSSFNKTLRKQLDKDGIVENW